MSLHGKPLTDLERQCLIVHGFKIEEPSQLADAFRLGVAWALEAKQENDNNNKIDVLNVSVKIIDTLKAAGINTVEDLVKMNIHEIAKIKGIGKRAFLDIDKALEKIGYTC